MNFQLTVSISSVHVQLVNSSINTIKMNSFSLVIFLSVIGICVVSANVNGRCEYTAWSSTSYECRMSTELFKRETDLTNINGTHIEGFNDDNVTDLVAVTGSIMPVTPIIFCEKFPNIRNLILMRVQMHIITNNSFSACLRLQILYLSFNRIRVIEADAFRNNVELINLHIPDNEIMRIEDNAFRNLVNLYDLELTRNRLTEINQATFRGLTNLTIFSVQGNSIAELNAGVFSDMVNVRILLLFSNSIRRIHPDFLETLPNGNFQLNVQNNQCIDEAFMFTVDIIDNIKPYFSDCFDNYRNYNNKSITRTV